MYIINDAIIIIVFLWWLIHLSRIVFRLAKESREFTMEIAGDLLDGIGKFTELNVKENERLCSKIFELECSIQDNNLYIYRMKDEIQAIHARLDGQAGLHNTTGQFD